MDSRYIKHVSSFLYELKDRASDGGARVHFLRGRDKFDFGRADCKRNMKLTKRFSAAWSKFTRPSSTASRSYGKERS